MAAESCAAEISFSGLAKAARPINDPDKRYVACYSSSDLSHWNFRGRVFVLANPENLGNRFILERPKVFYNPRTKKYVMYMHLDGPGYKLARVAVAISDKVDGQYQ